MNKFSARVVVVCSLFVTLLSLSARAKFLTVRTMTQSGGEGSQTALTLGASLDFLTNAYIMGTFPASVSIGASTLINTAEHPKIFVAKFSNSSSATNPPLPVWVVAATNDSPLLDLKFGLHNPGDAVVAGSFAGTNIAFGDFAITNSSPGLASDVFFGKYNFDGNAVWLKSFGGTGTDQCGDLATDGANNTYLAGSFESGLFTAGTATLAKQSISGSDCFLIKCSSSGSVIWARQGSYASASNVAVDPQRNCYIAGSSSGASLFDGLSPTNLNSGQFVTKYTSAGAVVWSRGDMRIGNRMVVDRGQNIISAGTFSGSAQFGSETISNGAPSTIFVVKYASNGDPLWAKQLPGFGHDEVTDLYIDRRTNYWVTGSFASNDNGTRVQPKMFLACFDSSGNLLGVEHANGDGISTGTGMTLVQGGILLYGNFSTNLTLLGQSITNNGDSELFLIKFNPVPPAIKSTVTGTNVIHSWPTPVSLGFDPSVTFSMEASADLSDWAISSNSPVVKSGQYVVTNSITSGSRFFRLRE